MHGLRRGTWQPRQILNPILALITQIVFRKPIQNCKLIEMSTFNRRRPAPTPNGFAPSGPSYSPSRPKEFNEEETAFLKAYLNGSHDNNYLRCPGCPSGSGTDVVLKHHVASTTINTIVGGTLTVLITGMPEAPIMYMTNGIASSRVVPYSNMPAGTTVYNAYGADYLKGHGVGRYRCASMAVKVIDDTPSLYQKGSLLSVRNPSAIDRVPITFKPAAETATRTNWLRVVEEFPTNEAAITSVSSNVYVGSAKDGFYTPMPYLDPLNPFINRDAPAHKAVYTETVDVLNDINGGIQSRANILAYKVSGSADLHTQSLLGGGGVNTAVDGLCPVHPENMQTQMILITGVDPVNAVFRISVVSTWEYVTSVGTDWSDSMQPPMRTNLHLLAFASEVFRGMPAGYPASANAWNDIWTRIKDTYANYVSPFATKLISNLPPQYAGPAAAAKTLLDAVADVKAEVKDATKAIAHAAQASASASAMPSTPRQSGRRK